MIARCSAGNWSKVAIGAETLPSAGVGRPRFRHTDRRDARRRARLRDPRGRPGARSLARPRDDLPQAAVRPRPRRRVRGDGRVARLAGHRGGGVRGRRHRRRPVEPHELHASGAGRLRARQRPPRAPRPLDLGVGGRAERRRRPACRPLARDDGGPAGSRRVRLHTHSWGAAGGRPIVGVHGVTGHGERFRRLAEERLADHRVVGVDLRGHGRSGYEPPWNVETHVADLAETARALGVERAVWAGFSFGGRLVAQLALSHPELVERLALLDPALELPRDFAREAAEEERADQSFASPEEAIAARSAVGTLVPPPRAPPEGAVPQPLTATADGRLAYRYSKAAAVTAWGEMSRP